MSFKIGERINIDNSSVSKFYGARQQCVKPVSLSKQDQGMQILRKSANSAAGTRNKTAEGVRTTAYMT